MPFHWPWQRQCSEPIDVSRNVALTVTCGMVERTAEDIAEDERWFTKAFNWVMEEIETNGDSRGKLFAYFRDHRNKSRILWPEFERLDISCHWPRAQAWLQAQMDADYRDTIDEIKKFDASEALSCLKAVDLRRLIELFDIKLKGRKTKAVMVNAILEPSRQLQDLARQHAIEILLSNEPRCVVGQKDIVTLLFRRITRASYRIHRAEQIMDLADRNTPLHAYTHITVWTYGNDDERAPCGLSNQAVVPIDDVRKLVSQPQCAALDCSCTFTAFSPELEARRTARSGNCTQS